jgi:ribosome-associated protein
MDGVYAGRSEPAMRYYPESHLNALPPAEEPVIDPLAESSAAAPLPPQPLLEARELATACAQLIDARKGEKIEIIQVGERLKVADYFVIASGTSRAHVKALFDELHVRLKAAGHQHRPAEGQELGWWIVLDYGDVIVHLLQPEARSYYDIERLYGDCPRLTWHNSRPILPAEGATNPVP